MQVTETEAQGLKRELQIVVPAAELGSRLETYLQDLKDRARIKGFRPGKVPMSHLRKVYGKAAMAEIVNTVIGESTKKALEDRSEKSVTEPKVSLSDADAEKVLAGDTDLAFSATYEVLPAFDLVPLDGIEIERPVAEVDEAEVDDQVQRLAEQQRAYDARGEGEAAQNADRVTIDYVGKTDGEAFQGGTAQDAQLVLGSGQFIPGFEEQLVGMKAGESRTITVTFPEQYPSADLAGKEATFDVTVKEVAAPSSTEIDDAFAQSLGIQSLDRLKEVIRGQIESQYGAQTRQKVKRQLLDQLDSRYDFDLPPSLVEAEFDNIWRQVQTDLQVSNKTFADEGTTEEEARAEYRKIAERRVRLGLVLSRIGEGADVKVTERELQSALEARVRQFPSQAQQLLDYYRNTPGAIASLQAPIFEEKVVDHILGEVKVTDKPVSKDELFADDEDETASSETAAA